MLFGDKYCTFNYSPFVSNCYIGEQFGILNITNQVIDEIKMDSTLGISNKTDKEEFLETTELDAPFQKNLEGGNLQNNGIRIQKIRFKKRNVDSLIWNTMEEVPYKQEQINYELKDYFVEAYKNVEYGVCGLTQSIESRGITKIIQTNYNSLFLTGRNSDGELCNYPLRFNLSMSDITLNEDKAFQTTLCSQYPILLSGTKKYLSGSLTATLISPNAEDNFGEVDMEAENTYREAFESFIHCGKPMLIRYHSFYILGIVSEPKKKPFSDDCGFGIYTFTFNFTEIGDAKNLDTLLDNGLYYDIVESTT